MSFGSEAEWIGNTGIRLETNGFAVYWCVDHTLSEIVREGLDEYSTAFWIGKDRLHGAGLRWQQTREIRIETSAGKRTGRRQI